MKVGDLVILPAGTRVFSPSYQANIMFEKEEIVKLTHGIIGNEFYFFGELQQLIFPFMFPGLIGKGNGEISLNVKDLKSYKIPVGEFLDIVYGKET